MVVEAGGGEEGNSDGVKPGELDMGEHSPSCLPQPEKGEGAGAKVREGERGEGESGEGERGKREENNLKLSFSYQNSFI